MICYFVRHGPAVDAQEWQGSDFDRPLTEKGRERMTRVAKRLGKLGLALDAIVASPLVRAKQTALIIGDGLGVAGRVVEDARLGSDFNPSGFEGILREHADADALMFVGHEPTMSTTLGHVLGGARLDFKKGAIACVEIPDPKSPSGTLLWMAPPKLLAE